MKAKVDDIERVLLRSIVERRETCEQAAHEVVKYLEQLERETARERLQSRDPSV